MTVIPSRSWSNMKEDFAFITMIITVYHFWMYSHLVSFKCKSGNWTHCHPQQPDYDDSFWDRQGKYKSPFCFLWGKITDLTFVCFHETVQRKIKKPWDFSFFFLKTKVTTVLCILCALLSLSLFPLFKKMPNLKNREGDVQSAAQGQGSKTLGRIDKFVCQIRLRRRITEGHSITLHVVMVISARLDTIVHLWSRDNAVCC